MSTLNAVLGPAPGALFPAVSEAVPLPRVIPRVPVPEMLLMVTVGVAVAPFCTERLPVAVPVVFNVTAPAVRLMVLAPV